MITRFFCISLVCAVATMEAKAFAESNYVLRSSIGAAQAKTEGSNFGMQKIDAGIYFDVIPFVKPGLSASLEHSSVKTNLFDSYLGTGLNFDLLTEGPQIGIVVPFLLVRIPLAHHFQADGNVNRHITNGTNVSGGGIEFPSSSGGTITTSSPRDDEFGYELKGSALGFGIDLGGTIKVSERVGVMGSLGYSWRNLVITEAKGGNFSMVGEAEYAYEQRHGVSAKGKTIADGFDVDVERRSRFFGAASLSLGVAVDL